MESLPVASVEWDAEGTVVSRPNRFLMIADVLTGDGVIGDQRVHVHDPGRLREIIYPGNRVRLLSAKKKGRTTDWTLVSGKVGHEWVLVNSSFHRRISDRILTDPLLSPIKDIETIKPEVKMGSSRLDYRVDTVNREVWYIEVKGCSLSISGRALFPDAPTKRGTRHVRELTQLSRDGFNTAIVVLVLAPQSRVFSPNSGTDPQFCRALREGVDAGVKVFPIDLSLKGRELLFRGLLPWEFI